MLVWSVPALIVPAGVQIHLRLTSATVMNSFFVPQLGSRIYTMAGMENQLYLQADWPGVFPGLSTHFSGDGFADMKLDVRAAQPGLFDAIVMQQVPEAKPVSTWNGRAVATPTPGA